MSSVEQLLDEKGIIGMVIGGSVIGQLVLVLLLLMSSLCWAIIVLKSLQLRKLGAENEEFLRVFRKEARMDQTYELLGQFEHSSHAQIFKTAYVEVSQIFKKLQNDSPTRSAPGMDLLVRASDRVQRVMERSFNQQYGLVEERLSILASISSSAPFVGLFGTVLGIIDSFHNIGTSGVTSLAAVAPGISEALVATAAGLLAAIPALIAYNIFRNHTRKLGNAMKNFSLELTNRIEWVVHERFAVAGE